MGDPGEGSGDTASHPLGRRIGRSETRVCLLKLLKLSEEGVVLGVADDRCVEHMVPMGMVVQQLAELGRPGGCIGLSHPEDYTLVPFPTIAGSLAVLEFRRLEVSFVACCVGPALLDCESNAEVPSPMSAGRIIAYVAAAILIFFGILFIWGAFSPDGSTGWILIGLLSVGAGFVLIWLGRRSRAAAGTQEIIQRVEVSGDVSLEKMACRSCGGALSSDNVKVVAGAPVVNCPYCGASYHLEEEPKW